MSGADMSREKAEDGMGLFKAAVLLFALLFALLVLAFGADWLLSTDNFRCGTCASKVSSSA